MTHMIQANRTSYQSILLLCLLFLVVFFKINLHPGNRFDLNLASLLSNKQNFCVSFTTIVGSYNNRENILQYAITFGIRFLQLLQNCLAYCCRQLQSFIGPKSVHQMQELFLMQYCFLKVTGQLSSNGH